ncbi:MAG: hypothetical protein IJ209_09450 [Bacteroidaceae bacterium]|nr:hypothetical protein [Bacteroidaceae bacterium]
MASKKQLKKAINLMCTDLLIELLGAEQTATGATKQDVENIAQSIFAMRGDFVTRLSHIDKTQVRKFFNQLEDDLNASTNEIIDQICHLA